ncbi:MAG: class I SAM-dependent methyltransferase [Saccharofermentanales bacterium]
MTMNKVNPFDIKPGEYDSWYDDNDAIYKSELSALSYLMKKASKKYSQIKNIDIGTIQGLEIGAGSGRFGSALGIGTGIDPSANMLSMAASRGMKVIQGVGENLPFEDGTFDYTAFFTSVCFLDDPRKAFAEAYRVTRKNGFIICSFLNRESEPGRQMESRKKDEFFYQNAAFFSCGEIIQLLSDAGYSDFDTIETIFMPVIKKQKHKAGIDKGLYGIVLGSKTDF